MNVCVIFSVLIGCSGSPLLSSKKFLDNLARDLGANDWVEILDPPPLTPKFSNTDQTDLGDVEDDWLDDLEAPELFPETTHPRHPIEVYREHVRDLKFGRGGTQVRSLSSCPPRQLLVNELSSPLEVNSQRFAKGSYTSVYKAYWYGDNGSTVRFRAVVKVVGSDADSTILETLYHDMAALEILQDTGIAPDPLHVAPHQFAEDSYCLSRLMVSSFVGELTLKNLLKSDRAASMFRSNLNLMASIAVRGLHMLKILHSKGIVHGDIHLENFVFYNDSPIHRTMKLIDYGRSVPFLTLTDSGDWLHVPEHYHSLVTTNTLFENPQFVWTPFLLSVYELESKLANRSHILTRRDDMHRFAELFIVLMLDGYEERLISVGTDIATLMELKRSQFSFLNPVFRDFFDKSANMRFDEEPLYDYWIGRFQKLIGPIADTPFLE